MQKFINIFILFLISFTANSLAIADASRPITIFVAKKIITMDPMQPEATAVAVKDGRIYSVGALTEMKAWMKPNTFTVNKHYVNDIITPGMIEAHSHWSMLVVFLSQPYVGYWDFPGLNGKTLSGVKTKAAVLHHLKELDKQLTNKNQVLFAWGYDPIYFNNEELTAADLDSVSTERPIFVLNASEHIAYINHVLLNKVGYNNKTNTPGVIKDQHGNPNGVLKEMAAAGPVILTFYKQLFTPTSFKQNLYLTADMAHRLGLTTVSDLLFGGPGENIMIQAFKQAANDQLFPERMVIIYDGALLYQKEKQSSSSGVSYLQQLIKQNVEKLRFGGVKFVSDGSIQGFTARLEWPGYFNGAPNGLFNTPTEVLKTEALAFWKAGFPIHVHVNGNQATESALDTLAYLQTIAPRKNNIYVLEHDQLSSPEQFRRAKHLGAYVNLFANHLYYWGDQHYDILLGPDRANRLDDAKEALRQNLLFSLHSDAPVTPLGPLHSMWAAMNRVTASHRILGQSERISAEEALKAVTLNAAYLLNLQNEIGSIEIGKRADFTILKRDPYTEPAMFIKDIPIVATVTNGAVFPVEQPKQELK